MTNKVIEIIKQESFRCINEQNELFDDFIKKESAIFEDSRSKADGGLGFMFNYGKVFNIKQELQLI